MTPADLDELILRLIAGVELFRHLERDVIAALLRGASKAGFRAGETVFDEGAEGHSLYVVVRGSFEVYRTVNGRRLRLAELHSGEHFGEIALLSQRQRTASVCALEESLAIRFSRQSFDAEPTAAAMLYRNMARMLAVRLLSADEEIMLYRSAQPASALDRLPAACAGSPVPRRIG